MLADQSVSGDLVGGGETDEAVERALIALTWRSYALAAILEPPVAFAFFWFIRGDVNAATLLAWASWAVVMFLTRALLALRWVRASKGAWDHVYWGRIFHLHSFAAAFVWGGAAMLFLPQMEPLQQAFLIAIICGVSGGAMTEMSSYLPALKTNIAAFLGPLAVTCIFLLDGGIYTAMGLLALVYLAYLVSVGRNHERSIRLSHRLHFERQGLIRRLEASKNAAERANRVKSDFLANMSHELRTPLNAIIGFSEMIKTKAVGAVDVDKHSEYAQHIHDSGRHLLMLVNGILDLSKAEAGDLDLAEERVDLREVGAACLAMLRPMADKAAVTLCPFAGAGNAAITADPLRVRQITLNLLSNAIKFTPQGGRVELAIGKRPDGGLDLRVVDTGIGMSADQLDTALQPFAQLDQGYSKQYQGSGLGLPITKTLVELHGGTMTIDSAPGQGTRVTVAFPAHRSLAVETAA